MLTNGHSRHGKEVNARINHTFAFLQGLFIQVEVLNAIMPGMITGEGTDYRCVTMRKSLRRERKLTRTSNS